MLHEAHAAVADFLNASRAEEIIFGNNMTTLTLHLSRSLARTLQAGDNILVTRLDHDANISPWMLIAEDKDCNFIWVDIDVENGTLDLNDFEKALERKPKIAAFGYASNLLGTVNPVKKLTKLAHEAGALVYIDAVQYAPHDPIDVQDVDCDFFGLCFLQVLRATNHKTRSVSRFAWLSEGQNSDLLEPNSKMGDGL